MIPMLDAWTTIFASPGTRTTGNKAIKRGGLTRNVYERFETLDWRRRADSARGMCRHWPWWDVGTRRGSAAAKSRRSLGVPRQGRLPSADPVGRNARNHRHGTAGNHRARDG